MGENTSGENMSFFGKLFGSGPKPPPAPVAPTVNQAIQKQKEALGQIDKKLMLLHHKYSQEEGNARKMNAERRGKAPSAKLTAALKRMKTYSTQMERLEQQRSNLETQMLGLDDLEMNRVMIDAIKAGNMATQQQMNQMNVDDVSDVIDTAAELQEDAEDIGALLAEPMGANVVDEDDLFADFLEGEADREEYEAGLQDEPVMPVMPSVAAPAAAAPVADEDDEFARLEAEMMM